MITGNMEPASEKLRKELEEELKLSTDQLRSHAWYHGALPRKEAESLLQEDGEFLIRDSRSSAGDYVLSCSWGGQALHFKIIRVVLRPRKGYSRTLFQFEQEQFDNVPALVRFYVGNRKPISDTSGAVVSRPVNRNVPLRRLEEHYRDSSQPSGSVKKDGAPNRRFSFRTATTSEEMVEANLLRAKDRSGSDPSSLDQLDRRPSLYSAHSDSNLLTVSPEPSPGGVQDSGRLPPLSPVFRTGSDPILRPKAPLSCAQGGLPLSGSEGRLHSKAPPKPLRVPSMLGSDYCELVPKPPEGPRSHVERLKAEERWRGRAHVTETAFGFLDSDGSFPSPRLGDAEEVSEFERPLLETASSFQPRLFCSLLLPPDNKPLDPKALKTLKAIFAQHDSRTTALHILQADCQTARITGVSKEQRQAMGVSSGLELITLPQGHQLRKDLLERHHLIALGIAVDILGCTGAVAERAAALQKIIQLAVELWRSVGDLFAFSAVMKALQLPQITRLEQTWRHLRQNHTQSAIAFEKELKPLLGRLNRAEGNAVPALTEVTVPHILPLLCLMEGEEHWGESEETCEVLLRTLAAARSIASNASVFRANAEEKLQGFQATPELSEAFQTEFALLLFWGSKGAEAERTQRHKKFDRILTVLSQKLE